jgi:hypothetical protein
VTPRDINRLEHAARTAFGFDERTYSRSKDRLTWAVSAALLVLLIMLVRRG